MRGATEWETDRARFVGRGRTPVNPVALDGRALSGTTGAVLDPVASLRERVHLSPGDVRADDVRDRRHLRSGVGAGDGAQISRRQRRGARALDGVHARPHDAAVSRAERRSGDPRRSSGVTRVRERSFAHQPGRHRRQHAGAVESLGSRDLRRPADRAGADHGDGRDAAGPPGAARAGLLAREGPSRRRRDPERTSGGVSRRNAAASAAARPGAAMGGLDPETGRHLPAADGRHAGHRSPPARRGGARHPPRRSRRTFHAAAPPVALAVRRAARGHARRQSGAGDRARAGAADRHVERPRRVHAGRPRVRHRARRRAGNAAAVVERHRQSVVRHDRHGVGIGVHVE